MIKDEPSIKESINEEMDNDEPSIEKSINQEINNNEPSIEESITDATSMSIISESEAENRDSLVNAEANACGNASTNQDIQDLGVEWVLKICWILV